VSFADLRSFLTHLEAKGRLARVTAEVDTDQEITIIQHRVLAAGGPALLFENVKGSPYRIASNLYGTPERVNDVFGGDPAAMGQMFTELAENLMPPSLPAAWSQRKNIRRILKARMKNVSRGPVMEECFDPPQLDRLPVLKCWPMDGGPFFTLPLVHTTDCETGVGNLGIYRLQRFDSVSTGMHWQIEKGGGFHFARACRLGRKLNVSVLLGGPPALTIAAITPLPEGIDERLLAALLMGKPLEMIPRKTTGHRIPARAEFVLEGTVSDGDMQQEGPFGDHLGHYSHSAKFPVFRVDRMFGRKDAIYPATVVGKPPQEDYYIGEAIQQLTIPLLKLAKPGVGDLWAYPETGFHPLAVAGVKHRYRREGLKHALGLIGEGQLSLTKVMIAVDENVNVKDFAEVSRAIWRNLDTADGLHLIAPTAQDTLDFTGPSMNTGSRLIILATDRPSGPIRKEPPPDPPRPEALCAGVLGATRIGPAILVVQLERDADREAVRSALSQHPATKNYLFQVLVSDDVPLDDLRMVLWGWFTRFDPLADLHPAGRKVEGNRMILQTPIAIDATWKEGYRKPVAFDPEIAAKVDAKWDSYGIDLSGAKP
jgi:4-hydroxybenzoate decarboxylase subunit C